MASQMDIDLDTLRSGVVHDSWDDAYVELLFSQLSLEAEQPMNTLIPDDIPEFVDEIQSSRAIRAEQDRAFEESLKADIAKAKAREEAEARAQARAREEAEAAATYELPPIEELRRRRIERFSGGAC
jgi:hypothetical protein